VYSSASDGVPGYTRFVYHGDQVAFQADSAGVMGLRFTWGLGTDDLRAATDAAGQHYYVVQDKLGSVRGLLQRDGTWRAGGRFNPYGDLVALDSAGPKPPIWYAWTGREFDEETGWYYHRARYYSPLVRRFVQEDPIGYGGGTNLYAYVEGQALESTDPSGTILRDGASGGWSSAGAGSGGGCMLAACGGTGADMGGMAGGGGEGGGTVYIDGVPVASGHSFLGLPGLEQVPSSGFYSVNSNGVSVFDSPACRQRGNCTQSQGGRMLARDASLRYDDAIRSSDPFFFMGGFQRGEARLLGKTAGEIISLTKKGSINRVFPEQFRNKTLAEIEKLARTGNRAARTAIKLLKNRRYDK
jgi:RHS repeat-associated protein